MKQAGKYLEGPLKLTVNKENPTLCTLEKG